MGNNGGRSDRELQALIRKTQREARKKMKQQPEDTTGAQTRDAVYVDRAGAADVRVEDATADEIFREMKRRDF